MNNNDFEFDSLIKKMAAEPQTESQSKLPSPGVIWWRSQILQKQAEAERIERPVKIMRALSVIISLVVVAGLWISQGSGIRGTFRVDGFPFVPILIVGAVIGAGFIGLLLWSTARFKSQT